MAARDVRSSGKLSPDGDLTVPQDWTTALSLLQHLPRGSTTFQWPTEMQKLLSWPTNVCLIF